MRVVFVESNKLSVMTARNLLEDGHEVIIIERDKQRIDELSKRLDCGFLHGDGGRPVILREAGPEHTDFLFCLTGNDQANIIASLVGRSQGFKHIVTKIEDPDLEHICTELGLENTIVPNMTISRFLFDMISGRDIMELSAMIKGDARLFSFVVREEDTGKVGKLPLPGTARVISCYRDGEFILVDEESILKKGDEVVVLTHSDTVPKLREQWARLG